MDNFAASKNLESGSSKPELQTTPMKKKKKKKKKKRKKRSFSCLQMKNINLKISSISPESNGEIRVWWQHSKILPSNILQKNGIPWLLTALHIIKAQNAPDFTKNIYTYL